MYEACCCCAAAAVVDLSSSAYAYPLAVLSLLRPQLLLPYLHLSPLLVFSIILTAMNSGRGWRSQFFRSGPTTGASGEKRVLNDHRPSKRSTMVRRFRRKIFFIFSERADSRYTKARLQQVSRKYSKIWYQVNFIAKNRSCTEIKWMKATTQMTHDQHLAEKQNQQKNTPFGNGLTGAHRTRLHNFRMYGSW